MAAFLAPILGALGRAAVGSGVKGAVTRGVGQAVVGSMFNKNDSSAVSQQMDPAIDWSNNRGA